MLRKVVGLVALALVLIWGAGLAADADGQGEVVVIPEAGVALTLPGSWRIESDRQGFPGELLRANSLYGSQYCALAPSDAVTVEAAAEDAAGRFDGDPKYVFGREDLRLPIGAAVRFTWTYGEYMRPNLWYFVETPAGVQSLTCGDMSPFSRDRSSARPWSAIAESMRVLSADEVEPRPFDPRVAPAGYGIAIDFPAEWSVGGPTRQDGWFGGVYLLAAYRVPDKVDPSHDGCQIEDHTVAVRHAGFDAPGEWIAALAGRAAGEFGWPEPEVTRVDHPTVEVVRLDWLSVEWFFEGPVSVTAWAFSDEESRYALLLCRAPEAPDDRWWSIAETLEFLPQEYPGWPTPPT